MIFKVTRGFCASARYYDTLGITQAANHIEVKKAYYQLVKKYHPDVNKENPDAEEKFKEIVIAYETLIDPTKR